VSQDWKHLTPVQVAYALLWRTHTDDAFVHRARCELLNTLTKDEQREAIKWVVEAYGPMHTRELIAADIRAGVFPQRSYDPSN
jgi:hypothetical protein